LPKHKADAAGQDKTDDEELRAIVGELIDSMADKIGKVVVSASSIAEEANWRWLSYLRQ